MPMAKVPSIGDKEHYKLLGLDHLRAFAILYVILFHYQFFGHPAWVRAIAGFGWSGVDLFFVLSGFLISGQLFATIAKDRKISLSEFFIKRFFRIIPPFLVVVILYAALPAVREWGHLSPLWRYLTFTLNFGLDLGYVPGPGVGLSDLRDASGATRVAYVANYTADTDTTAGAPDDSGRDCGGHGTFNASIVGGLNTATGAADSKASV